MKKGWREGNNYLIRLLCAKFDVGSVDVIVTYSTHCSRRRWCTGNAFCIVRACIGLLVRLLCIRLAEEEKLPGWGEEPRKVENSEMNCPLT